MQMIDPRKQRYFYGMMAGFGAISLSILLFFLLYRLQGVGKLLGELSAILAPFIYGGVMAYLLRPLCNALEGFFQMHFMKSSSALPTRRRCLPVWSSAFWWYMPC